MQQLATVLRTIIHHEPGQVFRRLLAVMQLRLETTFPRLNHELQRDKLQFESHRALPVFPCRQATLTLKNEICILGTTIPIPRGAAWHVQGKRLDNMSLHYMEWLEDLDSSSCLEVILDWIDANPLVAKKALWAAWNPYSISLRVVVWMQQCARHGWKSTDSGVALVLTSLAEQLHYLFRHLERDIGGNHLVKNLKALLWGASFFSGPDSDAWYLTSARLLQKEVDRQVLPDGMHFELSPAYHFQVFADLLEIRHVWREKPIPAWLDLALDRMAQVSVDITHPDGLPSQFSDGGLHMAYRPESCMRVYEAQSGRQPQARDHFVLEHAGYVGLRQGDSFLLWDCGPLGARHLPAHGHGDLLAIEWSVDGHRILVDRGVFEYEPGSCRAMSRGTFGHNTVTVEGQDQGEFWGSFRLGRRPQRIKKTSGFHGGVLTACGSHDGYRHLVGSPVHCRKFHTDTRFIEILDTIESTHPVRAQASFLMHPDCHQIGDRSFETPCGIVSFETNGVWEVQTSEWFPEFGVRIPTLLVVIDVPFHQPLHTCWAVQP